MKRYCTLNSSIEVNECKTCAYGVLRSCIFAHNTKMEAWNDLRNNSLSNKKMRLIMNDKLHVYNNIMSEKVAIEKMKQREIEEKNGTYIKKEYIKDSLTDESFTYNMSESFKAVNYRIICICILVSMILGIPLAYIGQIFQIFTIFFIDDTDFLMSTTYLSRYIYWTSLVLFVAVLLRIHYKMGKKDDQTIFPIFECIFGLFFIFVAICNINLLISTIIGPIIIFMGLILTRKT